MRPEEVRENSIRRCREKGILIPTFAELRKPETIDPVVRKRLAGIDLHAVHPLNLFRIHWRNDLESGGFGEVNTFELPPELTGVEPRIVGLVGSAFPTGTHKVGAAFGCLVPHLVTGKFDPTTQRAVWPSTGNYCRGGAFDSAVLGCQAVAILPEGMSRERFEWLEEIGAEILATPGSESNVKEIFDACWEIKRTRPQDVVFNQFEEIGNSLWHYAVTGPAVVDAFERLAEPGQRLSAMVLATGSAGTLGAGDYLKDNFPGGCRVTVAEALQCPTLLRCGFGEHRIEGIGDKHVPWIHNVRNTNAVTAIDDEATLRLLRLFNEPAGAEMLVDHGVAPEVVERLPLIGISGICNLLAAIKTARYFEFSANDFIFTSLTDSVELYRSYLAAWNEERGPYREVDAAVDHERYLLGTTTDYFRELTYPERRTIHNLKYFTWVEQQQRSVDELEELWRQGFWHEQVARLEVWDEAIREFNRETDVLHQMKKESTA